MPPVEETVRPTVLEPRRGSGAAGSGPGGGSVKRLETSASSASSTMRILFQLFDFVTFAYVLLSVRGRAGPLQRWVCSVRTRAAGTAWEAERDGGRAAHDGCGLRGLDGLLGLGLRVRARVQQRRHVIEVK